MTARHLPYRLLFALLLALLCVVPAYAEEPVEIKSAQDLAAIAENPSGSYILTQDVDLAGVDWTPFAFSGTLDGNRCTIRNLTVTEAGAETRETVDGNLISYDTRFAGLFSVLENAAVKDLYLSDASIALDETVRDGNGTPTGENTAGAYAGGLAGYAADSTILRCKVAGTVSLRTNAKANGVGGAIGFAKASSVDSCRLNTTLVLTDTDRTVRDENFLGGVYAAGYASVMDSRVLLDAYDSCHGYVHSGGLVGMYYPFGFAYDEAPVSSFTGNTVIGAIHFFEDNPSRRAYCEPTIGEIMNWNIARERNDTTGFTRDEIFAYDTDLTPEALPRSVAVKDTSFTEYPAGSSVTVSSVGSPIAGLYCVFWEEPGAYTVSAAESFGGGISRSQSVTVPAGAFLQQYIDLTEPFLETDEVTVTFESAAKVCGIYAVSKRDLAADGSLPEWVHDWKEPAEKADVLLLSTHADDEQLFFAGVLPYYAAVRGLDVQVVYLTDHTYELRRHQERLNGLWEVGVRCYPVSLGVPDGWADTYDEALRNAVWGGFTEEGLVEAVRETLDRFEPKVVVGHDEAGEYGHGQHILYTGLLERALADGWAGSRPYLQRVFLHLYETNPVTLSFLDTPFDELGGMTPFRKTQDGFRRHESQQWTWFRGWIYGDSNEITRADEIETYSPLLYGQYYGTGSEAAAAEGDFFAGIAMSYAEERREAERLEQERLAAEIAKQEAELRAAEEAAGRDDADPAGSAEDERIREDARKAEKRTTTLLLIAAAVVVLILALAIRSERIKRSEMRRNRKQ